MSNEAARARASEAKSLLANPLFKEAMEAVESYLDAKALTCDPDNKEMAQRVVISKQIMASIRREINRVIEEGVVAEIRIAELEKKKLFSVFRR